jgi:type VI secretion system protein ImpL
MVYIFVAIILVLYLLLAWFVGTFLRLQGASLWILRGSLTLIGLAGVWLFFWFYRRTKEEGALSQQSAAPVDELAVLLRQADHKLRASKQRSLNSFPVVFVLGELNSAKTSTVIHSGLEPELLAGHIFHDSDVVPTAGINVWFARDTIFIEASGKVTSDFRAWTQLLRQTSPGRLSAAVGQGVQAPRAALVCLSCESFVSVNNSAKTLGSRLKEMAQSLGAPFPVYVVFTKLDRIPHFAEFVGNLSSKESAQVLGATLPHITIQGVFAEEEGARLTKAFDQLIYAVAERRVDYLGREAVAEKLPGIYEFPRELRKIRNAAIQFLVELTRPTQLNANPFLRGFYFSGVRAIVVNDAIALAAPARAASVSASGATRMFNFADTAPEPAPNVSPRAVQSRKVPEWTFLPHLFTDIVLRDRVAFSSSHQSMRVDQLRRVGLASIAGICLIISIALLFSFFSNHRLQLEVERTATRLAATAPSPLELPEKGKLQLLDLLRGSLTTLNEFQTDGPPLSYKWGLYSGDRIHPTARTLYFENFQRLLLTSTQARIASKLRQLPDIPSPTDDYGEVYNSLKAYLMTTTNPEKSVKSFLTPILLDRWSSGRGVDQERLDLARVQFDFYSEDLPRGNPLSISPDVAAVERARHYLIQFNEIERIYQKLLFEAGRNNPSLSFNRMYPGSAAVVVNSHEIPGAFTPNGFKAVQEAIRNPDKLFGGEEWVLGDKGASNLSPDRLKGQLQARYTADFVHHWRAALKATTMVRYSSLADAAAKLQTLSGNASPLLQLFTLVALNTSVDSSTIGNAFQPAQLMAGKPEQPVGGANQPYVQALLQLQTSVAALAVAYPNGTTDPAATQPVQQAATNARGAVGQIAQSFRVDSEGQLDAQVRKLMEDPILNTEALVRAIGPGTLNAAGRTLCNQFQALARKYPLNPRATEEATLEDLKFFQPGSGALWSFYEANLKNVLQRQGNQFVANPSAPIRISAAFVDFLHRAAAISDALFASPGQPSLSRFTYTLQQPVTKGIDRLSLDLDGRTLAGPGGNSQQFVWPGEGQGLRLTASYLGSRPVGLRNYPGNWGVFHFFQDVQWTPKGAAYELTLPIKAGEQQSFLPDGTPLFIRYEIDANGAQFFHNYWQGLHCPPIGAH